MRYATEIEAELSTITDLASSLSDGMRVLTAQNLARPVNEYIAAGNPLPEALKDVDPFVDAFLAARAASKKGTARAMWAHPDSAHDAALYVRRKVWEQKVLNGSFVSRAAAALGTMVVLQRTFRGNAHEAINHAAKHNTDVAMLVTDIRLAVDETVKTNLERVTCYLANEILLAVPEVKTKLLENANVL